MFEKHEASDFKKIRLNNVIISVGYGFVNGNFFLLSLRIAEGSSNKRLFCEEEFSNCRLKFRKTTRSYLKVECALVGKIFVFHICIFMKSKIIKNVWHFSNFSRALHIFFFIIKLNENNIF